jgi:hypothetical protein
VPSVQYNEPFEAVVSIDEAGIIEYWSTEDYGLPKAVKFRTKMDGTDLYEFAKARRGICWLGLLLTSWPPQSKTKATSLDISPDGRMFAVMV